MCQHQFFVVLYHFLWGKNCLYYYIREHLLYCMAYHIAETFGGSKNWWLAKQWLFAKFWHTQMNVGCNTWAASAEMPKLYSPKTVIFAHSPKFCPSNFTRYTVDKIVLGNTCFDVPIPCCIYKTFFVGVSILSIVASSTFIVVTEPSSSDSCTLLCM